MSICPNCGYVLVLHEHRRKYKCSKCRKIYPQKEIELNEFVEYNKQQRVIERKKAKKEYDKEYNKKNKDKRKKWRKKYYENNKDKIAEYQKEYRKKNPDKIKEQQRNWRKNNRSKYNEMKREYWARRKKHLNVKRQENYKIKKASILKGQKGYRDKNKILRMINNQRTEQKKLAIKILEFEDIRFSKARIREFLPTILLS